MNAISSLEYSAGFVDGVRKGYEIAIDVVNEYRKYYADKILKPEGLHPSNAHETSYSDQLNIINKLKRYDPINDMDCRTTFTYKRG